MTLIATLALTAAPLRADDKPVAPPPAKMEGGVAVELIDPQSLKDKPAGVESIKIGNDTGLQIAADGVLTVRVANIDKPDIKSERYVVKGWVKYDDVEGDGYMESWNHFGGDAFFSRTLGEQKGPMQKIAGTSAWRVFVLPFNAEKGARPDRIEVNLVLAGKGKVVLTDLRLVDLGDAKAGATGAWWTERQSGWLGGILGCACAALGMSATFVARRSLSRSIAIAKAATACGTVLLAGALVAALAGQPWHVWYLLGLIGLILTVVFATHLPRIRRQAIEFELRRLSAADA